MIRFGVHRREQFSTNPGPIHLLLHGRRVSYRLLRTSTPATAGDVEIFDHIVYYLKLAGGVYTTTLAGRFKEFDVWLTQQLNQVFARECPLLIEDWGSSGATTSAEWFPVAQATFPGVRMVASDLNVYLIEASVDNDGVYVLEPGGRPLQYIAPPFVLKFPEPALFVLNRWMASRARKRLSQLAASAGVDLASLEFDHADQEIRRPPFVFRRLALANPRARALAAKEPAFQLAQHSVFNPSRLRPNVIRTMNVLNKEYFSDARLTDAARAVWESLEPGGVWVVGRTMTESPCVHHASILRKTAAGFDMVARYAEKSEVEDLALGMQTGSRA